MRIWLEKMAWKMQRFMMGRNGLDDLARHLYILGWVYLGLISKPKRTWLQWQRRWKERKTHCFFRCQCGTMLRVPKGKGEVIITCPNCHRQMTKRT